MAVINIIGDIIPNEWQKFYDHYGWDGCCPRAVKDAIDKASAGEQIDVYINSGGGVVTSGQEIYTALRGDSRVSIHIIGQACSAASFIAMAGKCDMSPVAMMMVHCASLGYVSGNHNDMETAARQLRTVDRAIAQAYVDKSGMTLEDAIKLMERETWLTANQCVEFGLADGITPAGEPTEGLAVAAAYGAPRLTQELIERAEREMADADRREAEKNKLLEDLDAYGV